MSDLTVEARAPRYVDVKSKRATHDWYQDQPEATEALLRVERFAGTCWDPCCGIGTIPKAMTAAGYRCFGTDITYRGYVGLGQYCPQNFLTAEAIPEDIDSIVSNPPYKDPTLYVDRALSIARHKVAFLLPLTFLEGEKRTRWRVNTPLARIRTFSWRINMPPGEMLQSGEVEARGGKKAFAWFIWEHGWEGPAQEIPLIRPGKFDQEAAA